jgi:hypothetical protein
MTVSFILVLKNNDLKKMNANTHMDNTASFAQHGRQR